MNIYLDYLGCRLNQAEIEAMAAQFQRRGHRLAASPAEADLIVLNTCAVTHEAARDSRQRLHTLHAANANARIIPTGCWTTLAPAEAASAPGVWQIVENARKDLLVEAFDREPINRFETHSARLRTRLFVKVQDGCDNHCAFCVTRIARGPGRSRPLDDIIAEINLALATGVKEIVLTGVHLGAYGHDLGDPRGLINLVKAILCDTPVERLRLSSLEPWDLSPDFFDLWPESKGRLCRHLHLPLQSGCAATLRRMARRTTPEKFAPLVAAARQRIPEVAISTDVIAGFPGETEREFEETMAFAPGDEFLRSARLQVLAARGHKGRRDARPDSRTRKERSLPPPARTGRGLGPRLSRPLCRPHAPRTIWEATNAAGPDGFRWQGYTENYLRVSLVAREMLWNMVTSVRLEALNGEGMEGMLEIPGSPSFPRQDGKRLEII